MVVFTAYRLSTPGASKKKKKKKNKASRSKNRFEFVYRTMKNQDQSMSQINQTQRWTREMIPPITVVSRIAIFVWPTFYIALLTSKLWKTY